VEAIDNAIIAAKNRTLKRDTTANTIPRPTMIIVDTIKGKGAAFCEGQVGSHNMTFDYEVAKQAIAELDANSPLD